MDEIYVTYVDDEHADNHDYDGNTDGDHDSTNDVHEDDRWSIDDLAMV